MHLMNEELNPLKSGGNHQRYGLSYAIVYGWLDHTNLPQLLKALLGISKVVYQDLTVNCKDVVGSTINEARMNGIRHSLPQCVVIAMGEGVGQASLNRCRKQERRQA